MYHFSITNGAQSDEKHKGNQPCMTVTSSNNQPTNRQHKINFSDTGGLCSLSGFIQDYVQSYEMLQCLQLLTSSPTPPDIQKWKIKKFVSSWYFQHLKLDILKSHTDRERFMRSNMSLGIRCYFWYRLSEYTPIPHNTTHRTGCKYTRQSSMYRLEWVPLKCRWHGGIEYFWIKAISIFVYM